MSSLGNPSRLVVFKATIGVEALKYALRSSLRKQRFDWADVIYLAADRGFLRPLTAAAGFLALRIIHAELNSGLHTA